MFFPSYADPPNAPPWPRIGGRLHLRHGFPYMWLPRGPFRLTEIKYYIGTSPLIVHIARFNLN